MGVLGDGLVQLSTVLVVSWLAVLCQVIVAFAYAQPLSSGSNIDFDYEVRETSPVSFGTLLQKKCSHFDSLQIFAEASRMYSVTCHDVEYQHYVALREVTRINRIVSHHEDQHGPDKLVPEYLQNFLGPCITWAIFRFNHLLRKKVLVFLLMFVLENMFQLHLKITYMAIQKRVQSEHFSYLLASSTAFSMFLSLITASQFVYLAKITYVKYRLFCLTISRFQIREEEYYLRYTKDKRQLGKQLRGLESQLALIFILVALGLWLLAWAAVKHVMVKVCDGGLWNLSSLWNLEAGCVPRSRTMSNVTSNATLSTAFNV